MRLHFVFKLIIGILLAGFLLLQTAVQLGRDFAVSWLLDQGADYAGIRHLEVDWFSGAVHLDGVRITTPNQRDLLLESIDLQIDYGALTEQRILVRNLAVTGLSGAVTQKTPAQQTFDADSSAAMQIGPLEIPAAAGPEETATDAEPSPWQVGLDQLTITGLDWQTDLPDQQHHLLLHQASFKELYFWQPQQPSLLDLQGRIDGADFAVSGELVALAEAKSASLKFSLTPLTLENFTAAVVPGLKGRLSADLALELQMDGATTTLKPSGSVQLDGFAWQAEGLDISQQQLRWQGDVDVALQDNGLQSVAVSGALNGQQSRVKLGTSQQADLGNLQWHGSLQLQAGSNGHLQQQADIGLTQVGWQDQQADLHVQQNSLNWQGDLRVELPELQFTGLQLQGKLAGSESLVQQASRLELGVQQLDWQGSVELSSSAETGSALNLNADNLDITSLRVHNLQQAEDLLLLTKLSLAKLQLQQTADGALRVTMADTALAGIKAKQKGVSLVSMDALNLQRLAYDAVGTLDVSRISLQGSQSNIALNKAGEPAALNGFLAGLNGLSAPAEGDVAGTEAAAGNESTAPLRVKIDALTLGGSNRILFTDRSAEPEFKGDILIKSASLKNIDTGAQSFSPFAAELELKPFTRLVLSGKTNLIGGGGDADWQADLSQLELPRLSPYTIKQVGYFIENGQLTLNSKGSLRDEQIEGDNHIVINRLEVDPVDEDKVAGFTKQLSMPLGTAIMVLQDDDDNIELDVPISGSLSDPDFGLQSVVQILAGKGLKQAAFSFLAKTLQPYGALVSLADTVIDAASDGSFINLQPVAFAPASSRLDNTAKDYLQKIEGMLQQRDAMRLNICGQAVQEDAAVLRVQLAEANAQRTEPWTEEQLEAELTSQLTALAQARNDGVKAYLSKAVDGERLFGCFARAKLKDPAAKPEVTLGL